MSMASLNAESPEMYAVLLVFNISIHTHLRGGGSKSAIHLYCLSHVTRGGGPDSM